MTEELAKEIIMSGYGELIGKDVSIKFPNSQQYGGLQISGLCVDVIGNLVKIEDDDKYFNIENCCWLEIT